MFLQVILFLLFLLVIHYFHKFSQLVNKKYLFKVVFLLKLKFFIH